MFLSIERSKNAASPKQRQGSWWVGGHAWAGVGRWAKKFLKWFLKETTRLLVEPQHAALMARQRDTKSTKTTGSHAQETYGADLRLQSWLREQDKKQKDLHERMEKLRVVQKMNTLNQCTFAPHTNHKDQNIENSSIQATVDRLYQDVDKINRTKRIL